MKMYGWYRCYNFKYYGQGFDVKDTTADQSYIPNSEKSRSTDAINALDKKGIKNSSGSIFETQYLAGSSSQNSGKLSHSGANNLSNNNYEWLGICMYYYDNSDKSSGPITSFTY